LLPWVGTAVGALAIFASLSHPVLGQAVPDPSQAEGGSPQSGADLFAERSDYPGIVDCPAEVSAVSMPNAILIQWIENKFHKWEERKLPSGQFCIRLLEPNEAELTRDQALALLAKSRGWQVARRSSMAAPEVPAAGRAYALDRSLLERYRPLPPAFWAVGPGTGALALADPEIEFVGDSSPPQFPIRDREASVEVSSTYLEEKGMEISTRASAGDAQAVPIRPMSTPGVDDRQPVDSTTTYFNNTVAFMSFSLTNGDPFRCTAFLVSPYVAFTAGHCVFDQQTRLWSEDVVISPGQFESDGRVQRPYGSSAAYQLQSDRGYTEGPADASQWKYDAGAVYLAKPFTEISTFMPLRFNRELSAGFGPIVHAGYPSEVGGQDSLEQWWDQGVVLSFTDSRMIYYDADVSGGDSGSAAIAADGSNKDVVAFTACGSVDPFLFACGPRLGSHNQSLIETWARWTPSGVLSSHCQLWCMWSRAGGSVRRLPVALAADGAGCSCPLPTTRGAADQ